VKYRRDKGFGGLFGQAAARFSSWWLKNLVS